MVCWSELGWTDRNCSIWEQGRSQQMQGCRLRPYWAMCVCRWNMCLSDSRAAAVGCKWDPTTSPIFDSTGLTSLLIPVHCVSISTCHVLLQNLVSNRQVLLRSGSDWKSAKTHWKTQAGFGVHSTISSSHPATSLETVLIMVHHQLGWGGWRCVWAYSPPSLTPSHPPALFASSLPSPASTPAGIPRQLLGYHSPTQLWNPSWKVLVGPPPCHIADCTLTKQSGNHSWRQGDGGIRGGSALNNPHELML